MLKVLELFAGIGACSKALTNLGIEHEIVDAVEIDKYAIKSFNAMHGTNFEPQDIRKWDKDIEVDLVMHGSPCQDFSIAGKQAGGDIGSETRSSLMYETIRIVEKLKPKYVIWENVKNLLSKKHRHNFDAYQEAMKELGYNNHYQVLNAKDYGVPQNRERVFTVSIRNDIEDTFSFPVKRELTVRLKDVLETNVDEKYYLTEDQMKTYRRNFGSKGKELTGNTSPTLTASMGCGGANTPYLDIVKVIGRVEGINGHDILKRVYDDSGVSPTLTTMRGGNQEPKIMGMDSMGTLDNYRIRKLTPKECWRLMGFADEDFEKAKNAGVSNSQLYKQAGNSIVVNVLMSILNNLLGGKHDSTL
jgi:DNA (cytosine-5)-methyltransferase 1